MDLDVVLLFHDSNADSFDDRDVRPQVVDPTIEKLGTWLRRQPGVTVNNIIRKARVPIVIFDTKELSVDISVAAALGSAELVAPSRPRGERLAWSV